MLSKFNDQSAQKSPIFPIKANFERSLIFRRWSIMNRASWGSRLGFILAVAGSAVGLANIWRFPYLVGYHGGAAFIILYFICLALIGFPTFIAEILIGRSTQTNPDSAFRQLGGKNWSWGGKLTIITGFIVASFYSAVAGWILGYFIEAALGNLHLFTEPNQVVDYHSTLMNTPWWGVLFHFIFMMGATSVLFFGVRNGIERGNKIMMPLLFVILFLLVAQGLSMPNAKEGLTFLFYPDWSVITPATFLIALSQAFFTLSVGQGTLVTYGSYLKKEENLITSAFPIIIIDTLVSILASVAVFTIVFSTGLKPDAGPDLLFHTLPWAFSQITGGYFLAFLFFLLVTIAALTSEISALEPLIAWLVDEKGWKRTKAVLVAGLGAFCLGIPSALSFNLLKEHTWQDQTFFDWTHWLASDLLIPIGGILAVILVGWKWGADKAINHLMQGASVTFKRSPWLKIYFKFCFKYCSPFLILLVFLSIIGLFR